MGQSCHTLIVGLIRIDIQNQFPSKQQPPGSLPSMSQSTISFLYKVIQKPFFPFLEILTGRDF